MRISPFPFDGKYRAWKKSIPPRFLVFERFVLSLFGQTAALVLVDPALSLSAPAFLQGFSLHADVVDPAQTTLSSSVL